jgi:MFS family permease
MLGVGQVVGELPAASFAARVGERRAMLASAATVLVAVVVAHFATHGLVLGGAIFVIGIAASTFNLSRQGYITQNVAIHIRARALSTLGGANRAGGFIGPLLSTGAIAMLGLRGAYWVTVVTSLVTIIVLLVVPDLPGADAGRRRGEGAAATASVSLGDVLRAHWRLLLTLGWTQFTMAAVRASRAALLPLWAAHLGLDATAIALVFAVTNAVDMSLFYPAGKVMDHYGRLAVGVPSNLLLGGSLMLMPLSTSTAWFVGTAILMSAGNGMGAGIGMTIGADAAPAEGKLRFLSAWRFMADGGFAGGPGIVSLIVGVAPLAAGMVVLGALGPLTSLMMARWVPRFTPFATRAAILRYRAEHPVTTSPTAITTPQETTP